MANLSPLPLVLVVLFLAFCEEVCAVCTLTTPDPQTGITDFVQFPTSWSGCTVNPSNILVT